MTRILLITITLVVSLSANSQATPARKLNAGVEADALPYITGRYFAAASEALRGFNLLVIRLYRCALFYVGWVPYEAGNKTNQYIRD